MIIIFNKLLLGFKVVFRILVLGGLVEIVRGVGFWKIGRIFLG